MTLFIHNDIVQPLDLPTPEKKSAPF